MVIGSPARGVAVGWHRPDAVGEGCPARAGARAREINHPVLENFRHFSKWIFVLETKGAWEEGHDGSEPTFRRECL